MQKLYPLIQYILLLFCGFLFGCGEELSSTMQQTQPSSPYRVDLAEARRGATFYESPADSASDARNARVNTRTGQIVQSRTISDSATGEPLLYIFKKEQGFVIVSADSRVMPVLAYSDRSGINVNNIPNGVNLWLNIAQEKIREAKRDSSAPHPIVAREWDRFLSRNLKAEDSNCIEWYQWGQFMCKPSVNQKGPLLTTSWGQRHLSTTQLSTGGNCDSCGRRLAGCGPVAMAQLEEFYHPNLSRPRFSNGICTATNNGEISLGALMKDMGVKASAQYNYMGTCNTFTWPSNVKSGLKNYGFSNGGNGNEVYNYNLIKSELNGNHPVIFWGSTCLDCFDNYHIWVCDGFKENYYSEFDCATKQCKSWTYTYLHMNWGWADINDTDGFYAFGQYNPEGKNYNGNLHVITGIRP